MLSFVKLQAKIGGDFFGFYLYLYPTGDFSYLKEDR
jgi:hypothetical protein